MANILVMSPHHPQPRKVGIVVDALDRGGLIAYPTDTVYGFGCDLHNRKAVDRVYQIRNLDKSHMMSFVCPNLAGVARYAQMTDFAYRILKRILPGPYTVIMKATSEVPRVLLQKRRTVGIRIPDSPIAMSLVEGLGRPILSSSVVSQDGDILADPRDIRDEFGNRGLDLVVDGGFLGNIPSTVISLIDDEIELIREGKGELDTLGL
ncbi:MAG: threonylcarbamoyl-AMP synthase [Deltaproteobacteria bacterium]|nr:threonylcarbamoyl-AMP synthase [Deltaproteobacteria bacterium]